MPLATPSNRERLAVYNENSEQWTQILNTEDVDGKPEWRCIEVISDYPCDLRLTWSVGGSVSANGVLVTCPKGVRLGVHALSLLVEATNKSSKENRVRVNTSDAHISGDNIYEQVGVGNGDYQAFTVPPFAEAVAVGADVSDHSTEVSLRLYDGEGNTKFEYEGDKHQTGMYLGATETVGVKVTADKRFRVVFVLTI